MGKLLDKADPSGKTLDTAVKLAPAALAMGGAISDMQKDASKGRVVKGVLGVGALGAAGGTGGVVGHKKGRKKGQGEGLRVGYGLGARRGLQAGYRAGVVRGYRAAFKRKAKQRTTKAK
tara:strand:+ start:71 stop:427 length:357 start_codon:yes stop_codon:yes gene_type:complete